MEKVDGKNITDKIIHLLRKTVTEMEELSVQAALGKAEARDLYEESKKRFRDYLQETRDALKTIKEAASPEILRIKAFLETLQVQLALGKAETREMFEEQKDSIAKSLRELESFIRNNKITGEYYSKLLMEIETFRIKLEIIRLRYELKKPDVAKEFEEKKAAFLSMLNDLRDKMQEKKSGQNEKWENFHDEITEAYHHLRKAFAG